MKTKSKSEAKSKSEKTRNGATVFSAKETTTYVKEKIKSSSKGKMESQGYLDNLGSSIFEESWKKFL